MVLTSAISRKLLSGNSGRGHRTGVSTNSSERHVGVIASQLTQLQARCLLAAIAFWAVASVITLPSLLMFGLLIIPTWATAEAAFFIWYCVIYRRLNAQPVPHRPPSHINPRDVFDRFIRDRAAMSQYLDIKDMISKWHWDMPISELTRDNVADLLCYGFYYRSRQQMIDEGMGHIPDQLVSELETAWDVQFRVGPYVPRPLMRHLWEPVRCFYRPLFFYMGVEVLIALKHVMLLAAGFRPHLCRGLRYYTYGLPDDAVTTIATSRTATSMKRGNSGGKSGDGADAPVLFLHGVGLGVLPYLNFLLRLSSLGRPAVAVEVRHLSMRLCTEVPEEDEIVERIAGALQRHGVRQVHVVAHSYGTFMASRLVHLHRPLVASLTLLDPVCFIMFSGKLIYNFVYRNPLQGASALTWFVARDLAHSVSVSRRFYWSLLNLWPDQLPEHTLVALSAQDELVPVPEVLIMLRECPGVRVRVHDGHRHADFVKDFPEQIKMVQMVAELIEQATETVTTTSTITETKTIVTTATAGGTSDSASDLPVIMGTAESVFANRCCDGRVRRQKRKIGSTPPGQSQQHHHNHHVNQSNHNHQLTSHVRSDSASSYDAAYTPGSAADGAGAAECAAECAAESR
ncbi:hypothetical protein VaNZ11_005852 [Volvox africanus]|uniref:AB hydrolase-1 domain-containing protein n=1 Tax=Volvox africanus TaxID=51714 RepID=A0ABQ5S006_9CHLO|nr:hypothetical protein VaNZ11_005852 [Volvox africanus]